MNTAAQQPPTILIVDDDSKSVQDELDLASEGTGSGFVAIAVHPQDLQADDLRSADLVLVDYHLDNWPERNLHSNIAMKPQTGLSLAMVIRDQLDSIVAVGSTAIALQTGFLKQIRAAKLISSTASHVVARLNNLEWIFEKSDARRFNNMVLLASAVQKLPDRWPASADEVVGEVRRLLDLKDGNRWLDRCWRDVRECQVPMHELTSRGHGIQFVRWLLHQILPYPTFLIDKHWVAARLEITVEAVEAILAQSGNQLADDLRSIRYNGMLSGFLGDRWWRGALENYTWELVGGGTDTRKQLHAALCERFGGRLTRSVANPVVCLDHDLRAPARVLDTI